MIGEIIEVVAEAKDTEPEDLDISLQDHVNLDSIESLAAHENHSWVLEFEIPNHTIRVTGHGGIFVDGAQQRAFS